MLRQMSLVSLATLLSRLLGFIRDILFASYFGSSMAFDAFIVAYRIPNFFRALFAEGAFSDAFIPVFSEEDSRRHFVNDWLGCYTLFLILLITLLIILAPHFITLFAPGFTDPQQRWLCIQMFRIMTPFLLTTALTSLFVAIINCNQYFFLPACLPCLLNLGFIGATLLSQGTHYGIHGLHALYIISLTVPIVGALQCLLTGWFTHQRIIPLSPTVNAKNPQVIHVFCTMLKTVYGASASQLLTLTNTILTSFLVTGSMSWLYYADRIVNLPIGLIAFSICTVNLPALSKASHANSPTQICACMMQALRLAFILGLPSCLGIILLAQPITSTLFMHHQFNIHDMYMTQASLIALGYGLPAIILSKILTQPFYAKKDANTPVKITTITVICNLALNSLLIIPLQHVGLSWALSISAYINCYLLLTHMRHEPWFKKIFWHRDFTHSLIGTTIMAFLLILITPEATFWENSQLIPRILTLGGLCLSGATVYLGYLYLIHRRS